MDLLESVKEEQGLIGVKHAFYLTGRELTKRKVNVDRKKALETLDGYVTLQRMDFLVGVAYRFTRGGSGFVPLQGLIRRVTLDHTITGLLQF